VFLPFSLCPSFLFSQRSEFPFRFGGSLFSPPHLLRFFSIFLPFFWSSQLHWAPFGLPPPSKGPFFPSRVPFPSQPVFLNSGDAPLPYPAFRITPRSRTSAFPFAQSFPLAPPFFPLFACVLRDLPPHLANSICFSLPLPLKPAASFFPSPVLQHVSWHGCLADTPPYSLTPPSPLPSVVLRQRPVLAEFT